MLMNYFYFVFLCDYMKIFEDIIYIYIYITNLNKLSHASVLLLIMIKIIMCFVSAQELTDLRLMSHELHE